jgi:hypothetical protein
VKPKTWRISAFADARLTPLVPNSHGNHHMLVHMQGRSEASEVGGGGGGGGGVEGFYLKFELQC